MSEEEINDLIIQRLREMDEDAATKFENYHRVYVRTSEGIMESFNKEKIITSLLKETTLAKSVCEEIAAEVESDIRRLELKYVSAPLIREMVNSKLLERKHMQAKKEYMRLGLPIFDVTQTIKQINSNPEVIHQKFGDSITAEYALVSLLPEKVSKSHLTSSIHIHDLPCFATRPVSLQNDLRWFLKNGVVTDGTGATTSKTGPAKRPGVAISHALRVLISGKTHLSGGQGFDFFNTFLAPYTINKKEEDVKQLVQSFLYELNQIYASRGVLAQSTLNFELETPSFLKKEKAILPRGVTGQDTYYDYERESVRFLNLFLETMMEGDVEGTPFQMPKIVIKVREGAIPIQTEKLINSFLEKNDLSVINLRNKRLPQNVNMVSPTELLSGRASKWFNTLRTGVLQEVSINLPKIGLTSKEEVEFFNRLDSCLDAAKQIHQVKKRVVEKRLHKEKILSFLSQSFGGEEYYSLENAPSIVNVVGLDNCVNEYLGKDIKEEEGLEFAEKVLAYINRKLESFNESEDAFILFGCLDASEASERFSQMNEKRFGIKEVYPSRGFTHRHADVGKWINTESKLQNYCNGGAKMVVEEWDKPVKTVYELLRKEGIILFTLKTKNL
jgi:ribonucleoside-triphosphate reductase